MQDKITNVFIGDGTALKASTTAFTTITSLGVVDQTMTNVGIAPTVVTSPTLYVVNKLANGDYKKSVPINGTSVTGYKRVTYAPATRCVWGIGYHRAQFVAANSPTGAAIAAGGSIEVNNSTLYSFDLHFTNDKTFYSERPEYGRFEFTSSASATQLTIATQIAAKINASAFGSAVSGIKEVISVVIGDGTGVYGLTGATNYGVEVWTLDINQFRTTTYTLELVNFSVQCDSSTGFGATTVTQLQGTDIGSGTYEQVYIAEKVGKRNEGVLNWTKFPIPVQDYLASSTGFTSDTLAVATVTTGLIGEDRVTFNNATSAALPSGSKVIFDSAGTPVSATIKYWSTNFIAVLEAPLPLTLPGAATVAYTAWYDSLNINITDVTTQDGSGANQTSKKIITIYTPATSSSATVAAPAGSPTGTTDLQTLFGTNWIPSTALGLGNTPPTAWT